jgi:hypothetical protein
VSTQPLASVATLAWPGPGYWERLESSVRAEFRIDMYRPAHDDPILRRERACAVPSCRMTLGPDDRYCRQHETQWADLGRPGPEEFLALIPPTEPARISGGRICAVVHCANPAWANGWCRAHDNMWKRRRGPADFEADAPVVRQARLCRVRDCGRPEAVIAYGLCASHRRHWPRPASRPWRSSSITPAGCATSR